MPPLSPDSPAVQTHLTFLQGIIQRMAGNSASAKTWCIAIVAALLTLSAEKAQPILAEIALLPTLIFMFLDAYYLALERCFRQQYNQIVQKLNENTLYPADLYKIDRCQGLLGRTIQALGSFSVWGFYGGLIVGIILLLSIMA